MKSNKCNNQLIMKDSDTLSDTLSMPKIIDDHLICTLFNLDPHKIQLVSVKEILQPTLPLSISLYIRHIHPVPYVVRDVR